MAELPDKPFKEPVRSLRSVFVGVENGVDGPVAVFCDASGERSTFWFPHLPTRLNEYARHVVQVARTNDD